MALATRIFRRRSPHLRDPREGGLSDIERIWEVGYQYRAAAPEEGMGSGAAPRPESELENQSEDARAAEEPLLEPSKAEEAAGAGAGPEAEAPVSPREEVEEEAAAEAAELAEEQVDEPADEEDGEAASPAADEPGEDDKVSLSSASFEELRALGLSVTQANRLLRHREQEGFASLDDLDRVPGFPKKLRVELKARVTA